jgi:glutamyl-tRNA synthetase
MVVTRFAPSPTGYLHVGGLRTALFSYLQAKREGGKFLLRIEDTDLERNSQEATDAILKAFEWVGLSNDGEITYQSKRSDIYKKYMDQLLAEGKAYYCYTSREDLDALREKQRANGERPGYDGEWRDSTATPPEGVAPVIRIKAPLEGSVTVKDRVKGDVVFNWSEIDDFIIARADGSPTYNLVVAIDDALMGVTEVIRGDDHLSNTPKQIVVYNALGLTIPNFAHVPMILNEKGKKLSKRDGAMDVMDYKTNGYLPEALLNFLVRLGWSHGDQETFSMDEMLKLFSADDINKSASAYNLDKLAWLNANYIKEMPDEALAALLVEYGVDVTGHEKLDILLHIAKDRAKTLVDLKNAVSDIINRPSSYSEKDVGKTVKEDTFEILEKFVNAFNQSNAITPDEHQELINNFLKEHEVKMANLGKPLRLALFGVAMGPNIADVLAILGKNEISERIILLKNNI